VERKKRKGFLGVGGGLGSLWCSCEVKCIACPGFLKDVPPGELTASHLVGSGRGWGKNAVDIVSSEKRSQKKDLRMFGKADNKKERRGRRHRSAGEDSAQNF